MTLRDRVRASVLSETILSPHRTESCDVLAPIFVGEKKAHKPLFPKVSVSFESDASLSSLPLAAMARPVHLDELAGGGSVYSGGVLSGSHAGGSYMSSGSKGNITGGGLNAEEKARQSVLLTYETFLPRLNKAGPATSSMKAALGPSKRGSPLIPTFHDSYGVSSHNIAIGTDTDTLSLFGGPSLNSIESNEVGQQLIASANGPSFMSREGHPNPAAADVIAKHKRVSQMRAEKALARQQQQMQQVQAALASKTPVRTPSMSESVSSPCLTASSTPGLSSLLMGNTSLQPAVPPGHHHPFVSSGHTGSVDLGRLSGVDETAHGDLAASPRPQSTPLLLSSRQVSAGGDGGHRGRGALHPSSSYNHRQQALGSVDGGGSVGDVFDS
jgi:hypothetical protein